MIDGIFNFGTKIIDKLFPDKNEAERAKLKLIELQQNGELTQMQTLFEHDLAQAKINEVEAGHSSIFVAGWRPAVGWVCVLAIAWNFLFQPTFNWVLLVANPESLRHLPSLPRADFGELFIILANMLGFGALRSWEKIKGIGTK
ncbi:holin family protein [Desulfovibrio litoralis]|uniref:Holin of 3TMs, for gene-transfer release n=1 Tax=Desulfovibrio litoralis DSM 11393 TaxID=1121455 RepID=A0A1M7T7Y3_9BACT|nr:holin family protein [Desulfovibrio litoralis]SHN66772.1 Holin of 3TMs, for gene-transfer release [Desulfovibrio litoralis DSM 11393]